MAHFFASPGQIDQTGSSFVITGTDAHHMTKVLRLRAGERITVADGRGRIFYARIVTSGLDEVECMLDGPAGTESSSLKVTVVQGIPKGPKMDMVIEKCTELGAYRIVPLISKRVICKVEQDGARLVRWQRIAMEAAKQSRRGTIPEVTAPVTLEEVFGLLGPDGMMIMPWEEEKSVGLGDLPEGKPGEIFILVGPEGGFAPEEAAMAQSHGALTVSLGSRIMRTETAGLVTLALVLFRWGELGWVKKP